jgi:ectoine hydroxylase-related dioxygenase (phytanoyl-CoA dioxygenase family)
MPTPAQLQQLADHGYCVVDTPFSEEEIATARQAIERVWQARQAAFAGGNASRLGSPIWARLRPELPRMHREDARLAAFMIQPFFAGWALAMVGADADVLWNQAHVKAPGGDPRARIPWHQDGHYVQLNHPVSFSCWVALTDATVENGALRGASTGRTLLPHSWDSELEYFRCQVPEAASYPLEVRAGQAIVFDTRWAHSSGANHSAAPRVAYSLSFTGPGAKLSKTGERFGDQVPLLRGGRPIAEVMAELAQRGDEPPLVVEQLIERAPEQRVAIQTLWARYVAAVKAHGASDGLLCQLLSIAPEDEMINGDLIRARVDVDQILHEAQQLLSRGDLREARLLLQRALDLDRDHAHARRLLAALPSAH